MSFIAATERVLRVGAIAVALAFTGTVAHAQTPSKASLAAASEIVTITGSMNLFNPLIPGVVEQAKVLYLQQNPGLAKDANEIAAKMREDLAPRMSEIAHQIAVIYTQHFTEQELKDLVAFYKSPLGKKLVAQQPIVADESLRFAQDWATKLSDEVVAKMREELKKKGHAL